MKFSNGHIFKHIKGCAPPPHFFLYIGFQNLGHPATRINRVKEEL